MSTPTAPKPYTPKQILNNLRNFVTELQSHPDTRHADPKAHSGPGYVLGRCFDILSRGIEPATTLPTGPGSLLDTLANVTATLDNVLLHQGQHMTAEDLYQRRLLVASTRHTLQQHGIPT
jgi:hypothetical protein